ncbi:MAG: ubiquinone biosynthesis protein COQ9 [Kiritimatiellia bacterium]|jgi:ubiquinone biosynthesis protein COQ9
MDKIPPQTTPARATINASVSTAVASITAVNNSPTSSIGKSPIGNSSSTPSLSSTAALLYAGKTDSGTTLPPLLQALKSAPSINVEVNSAQLLTPKALQLLAKVNPTLAATLQPAPAAKLSQSAHNIAGNVDAKPAANLANMQTPLYLIKLSSAANPQNLSSQNLLTQNLGTQNLLTTVTPVAFKIGDQLQLQLNSQQQIVIKPTVAGIRPAIAESLRTALPTQQPVSQLLNSIQNLQKLPANIQNLILSKNTMSQLQAVSQFAQTNHSLSSALQIKNALINSGVLTEQKLQTQQSLSGDLRATLTLLTKTLSTELASSGQTKMADTGTAKSSIDVLVTQLLAHMTTLSTPTNTNPKDLPQNIKTILQLLGFKTSANQHTDIKKIREAINKQLSQMTSGAQEKIHLNQLRSLNIDSQSTETANAKNLSFTTEIPLRWGDQVLPLQISIKEREHYPAEENAEEGTTDNDNDNEDKKIIRRWQVFLSFDLPSIGGPSLENKDASRKKIEQLHTQLMIIEDTISVTLWTESDRLCEKASEKLSDLRNILIAKGLNVEDLTCIKGKPPKQELSIDYNLVDIIT